MSHGRLTKRMSFNESECVCRSEGGTTQLAYIQGSYPVMNGYFGLYCSVVSRGYLRLSKDIQQARVGRMWV